MGQVGGIDAREIGCMGQRRLVSRWLWNSILPQSNQGWFGCQVTNTPVCIRTGQSSHISPEGVSRPPGLSTAPRPPRPPPAAATSSHAQPSKPPPGTESDVLRILDALKKVGKLKKDKKGKREKTDKKKRSSKESKRKDGKR